MTYGRTTALLAIVGCLLGTPARAAADAPRDLADYAVLGLHRVELGKGAVVAAGSVGVNDAGGALRIDDEVFLADDTAVVGDRVFVGDAASLFDVFANDFASASPPVIRGAGPTAFVPPIATLPPLPAFAPDVTPVAARGSAPVLLPAGAYGTVVVAPTATLELTGGTYEFAALSVHVYGSVIVDAPSVVNIEGDVKIGAFGSFGPASGALTAGDVHVNVGGVFVRIERTTHVGMQLFAPRARVRLGRSVRAEGRFIADEFDADETLNLRSVAADVKPAVELCTLTQDAYGAPLNAADPLANLVIQNPEIFPVTVGAPGISSVTIPDLARLTCFLPATGIPASLYLRLRVTPGDTLVDACAKPPILDFLPGGDGASGGLGGGVLVGEVLAAKLNVALSDRGLTPGGLAGFVLPPRLCTTRCPEGRVMDPNPMKFQTGAVGVADGLTTVASLLAYADHALSVTRCRPGTCTETNGKAVLPPNPIRLSDIQNALQVVNECFSGCATVMSCAE